MKTSLRSVAVTALLMVLAGCSAQVGPPIAPPAAPGSGVVATSSVESMPTPSGEQTLDANDSALRFDALQRFYDEEPRLRDMFENPRVLPRGGMMSRSIIPDLHYIRFTDGARTVYGVWTTKGLYLRAHAEEDKAPIYPAIAFKRCASKYPAVAMTEEQRAAFLRDASAYPGLSIEVEDLDTVRNGRAMITTVRSAEYLWYESDSSDDLFWIWDPKSDTVFEVLFE